MADQTIDLNLIQDTAPDPDEYNTTFDAIGGLGLSAASPLVVDVGDVMTFRSVGPAAFVILVEVPSPHIFTDGTDFQTGSLFSTFPTKTIATGTEGDIMEVTAAEDVGFIIGSSDSFFFEVSGGADTTPDNYTNLSNDVNDSPLSTVYYAPFAASTPGTTEPGTGYDLTGEIDTATEVSITGGFGEFRIDSGSWTSTTNSSVGITSTVYCRLQAPSSSGQTRIATLTIGGISQSFSVDTGDDTTPNSFDLGNLNNQARSTADVASSEVVITGINTTVTASLSGVASSEMRRKPDGGSYGSWGTANITNIALDDTLQVRHDTSSNYDTTITTTLTVGGTSDDFTTTTIPDPLAGTNRIVLGNHPNYGYGLFISKPYKNILTNLDQQDLIFDSRTPSTSSIFAKYRITIAASSSSTTQAFGDTFSAPPHILVSPSNSSFDTVTGWGFGHTDTGFDENTGTTTRQWWHRYTRTVDITTTGITITRASGEATTNPAYFVAIVFNSLAN